MNEEQFAGFMYLDVDDPLVAWNTYRGCVISASQVHKNGFPNALSVSCARHLRDRFLNRFATEITLDRLRATEFPAAISRLTGLFVFADPDSALNAADASWGGHIENTYLTDVGVQSKKRTVVDANWIPQLMDDDDSLATDWQDMARLYWSGQPFPGTNPPIWESIVDGSATIWGLDLRQRAYSTLQRSQPKSLSMLEVARAAAHVGSDFGHVSACLVLKGNAITVSYTMDARDGSSDSFLAKLEEVKKNHPDQINWQDLRALSQPGEARFLDLRAYTQTIALKDISLNPQASRL
ncbi:MAG: hypothetical protein CML16_17235 [Pusillimonas sp.]|nr:hypothetical protein [Pusillimonas sp.]MBC44127.1 hypothetical protein [Pusillimonas sp.]HCP77532.1 hypothetical protein [Pusillimonas sp.]|tara:strand:+ start:26117 stop:27001 length:885 start_codon:yes stop_codon:yes gene_type:complete